MELDYPEFNELGLTKKSDQLLTTLVGHVNRLKSRHDHPTIESIVKLINEFEAGPDFLDPKLSEIISFLSTLYLEEYKLNLSSSELTRKIGLLVYQVAKVRGPKVVTRFFSSDVYLVLTLIELIQNQNLDKNEVFLNLLWLSNLVMVPFPFKKDMIDSFFQIGLDNLEKYTNGSKNQQCALILLSRFLSRPDLILMGYLGEYFAGLFRTWSDIDDSVKLGHFMIINKLLKACPKTELFPFVEPVYQNIIQFELVNLHVTAPSSLNLCYIVKILSKLGQHYAMRKDFTKVSLVFNNLIDVFRLNGDSFDTNSRYAMAKSWNNLTGQLRRVVNYHEQLVIYILKQLELELDILEPSDYVAPEINTFFMLDLNYDDISIPKYHTILLFLGYALLSKSLRPHLFPTVLSLVHRTIFTSQQRYNLNLGTQLKDSSCFVLWAMLRCLTKDEYQLLETANEGMFRRIFLDVLEVSICDKDLIIRRCGIAVIQEFVGRFGTFLVPAIAGTTGSSSGSSPTGEISIKIIELFTPSSVSTITDSLAILTSLIPIGLDKSLAVNMLVRNLIANDNDFEYQKHLSSKMNELLSGAGVDIEPIVNALDKVTHRIYFKSQLWFHFEPTPKHSSEVTLAQFNSDIVEDFLMFLQYCAKVKYLDNQEELFRKIIHKKQDISSGLIDLFKLMAAKNIAISQNVFISFLQHFTVPLAKSIFYLHHMDQVQLGSLVEIIHSSHINHEIRAELIKGIHINYPLLILCSHLSLDTELADMVCLLNDYTTTEQGDVGSQIRSSMLDFITEHPAKFRQLNPTLLECLIRISGESMAKLRHKAFTLLLKYYEIELDTSTLDESEYYRRLFKFYHGNVHNLPADQALSFWKGIVFSIGGLTGDSGNIRNSYKAFLKYLETCDPETQKQIFKHLFGVITKKKPELQRTQKEYLQGLNTIIKLFESNIAFPPEYLSPLYAKCYNLQINTNTMTRIKLTIKVMQYLVLQQDSKVRTSSIKRVMGLMKTHKSEQIRKYCLEVVYELVVEMDGKYIELETMELDRAEELEEYLLSIF